MSSLLRAVRSFDQSGRHRRPSQEGDMPWPIRATAHITLLGPPGASLILLAVYYFEYWRSISFNFGDFLVVFFLFAIPVGYAFGIVPALLAALLY